MHHGVLGPRYAYDGPTDPVFRSQVVALLRGAVLPWCGPDGGRNRSVVLRAR